MPPKDWAIRGKIHKGGKYHNHRGGQPWDDVVGFFRRHNELYSKIADSEVRHQTYGTDDAELLLVAYGSSARMAQGAVDLARGQGLRVGLLRPVTLWPLPEKEIRELAQRTGKVLVVEDCEGQIVDDVRAAVQGQVPVHLLGIWGRHNPGQRSGLPPWAE